MVERDCNTCRHHKQGKSLSLVDVNWCSMCLDHPDELPHWDPIKKPESLKEAFHMAAEKKPHDAPQFLRRAAELMEERGRQYDAPEGERSMERTVAAFNSITGQDLTESEGWLLMQILKDVRQWQREDYHADSAEDCIAYSALKAESLARTKTE